MISIISMAADITWSTTTPNKNKNDQRHGQEQEQEEEDYGVSEESCIFNCPYVEEQVNAEVTIESSRALAGGGDYYYYYTSNSLDRRQNCCCSSSSSSSGAGASGDDACAGAATSISGQEREQLLELRLEDAAEQEEEYQEEEEQCAASSSSSTILGHPAGLGQGQRVSTAVAVVREQQEHEVGSGCSHGASVTIPTTQTASVLLDTVAFGTRPSTSSTRRKTLSPEEVNFILKWKYLRTAANQKQTFRNMTSAAMGTSCSLSTVPEKEEVLELGNSASSSAGCNNHQQDNPNHHPPAVIRGVVSPHDMLRSFPNVACQDTISLLDYDLSMSQDDETNVNNDEDGGAKDE